MPKDRLNAWHVDAFEFFHLLNDILEGLIFWRSELIGSGNSQTTADIQPVVLLFYSSLVDIDVYQLRFRSRTAVGFKTS